MAGGSAQGRRTVVVTGAFGYSGRFLAKLLLERGYRVRTLTGKPERPNPLDERIATFKLDFEDGDALARAMEGADVFVNTYWVRFPYRGMTFERAVENSRRLFEAAWRAGVARIVHTSITNPSLESPLGYYRGKAEVEQHLKGAGIPYAILRPNVLFGGQDVLVNNIAWGLRRFPFFAVPGDGRYGIQPTHVEDYARLMLEAVEGDTVETFDACGPEIFAYEDLAARIGEEIGCRRRIVHVPSSVFYAGTREIGRSVGDVLLTREEIAGLMGGLLVSNEPPRGKIRLSEWLRENASTLGVEYASEVGRHFR